MVRDIIASIILSICCITLSGQHEHNVYKLDWKGDGVILGIGAGLTGLGHHLLSNADLASESDILNLDRNNLPFLDRSSALNNSKSAKNISDIILFSTAVLPFATFADHECRGDEWAVGVMALEIFLINNGITNIIKAQAGRYRPFNYNPEIDIDTKLGNSSRLSFLSGHASNTAALAFFTAKVVTDLHPDMKDKYLVWIPAAVIPAAIGYLRVKAGKHFPADVISGYVLGAGIGYLIPSIHKREDLHLDIGAGSFNLTYKF